MLYMNTSDEYLLQCEGKDNANFSVHTSELQQDVSFISGSLDSKFLLSVQLCPLVLCDCPRLLHGKPRQLQGTKNHLFIV